MLGFITGFSARGVGGSKFRFGNAMILNTSPM